MSPADRLLPLLHGVRRTQPNRWIARCPGHDDASPSLSLRETDDGRLLVHCWAGCEAAEVMGAVGLDLGDLFPPRDTIAGAGTPRERRPWSALDVLNLAAAESQIVFIAACDMAQGRPLPEGDRARLTEAANRLGAMLEAVR